MGAAVSNRTEDASSRTVEALLSTAERLFAERGVENVALTEIVAASGQKNRSALHYHFGSRSGVLAAAMDRRLAPINARRLALLNALPADSPPIDILRADIAALALTVVEAPWGADYVSVLAQVRFHPQLLGESVVRDEHLAGLRLARQRLRGALPATPVDVIARRFVWLTDSVAFALARWVRETPAKARTAKTVAPLIEDLAAYGAAGLAAPHGERE